MTEAEHRPEAEAGIAAFAGGAHGAAASAPQAAGADSLRDGMDLFRAAAERLTNVDVGQSKGNLFEYIEAARFNRAAAEAGSELKAIVTAAAGAPTAPDDLRIMHHDEVVKRLQAKVSESSTRMASAQADPKYEGMDRLVPSDKAELVRNYSEVLAGRHGPGPDSKGRDWSDSAPRIRGETEAEGISSEGTTLAETIEAGKAPGRFALKEELGAVASEVKVSAAQAALAAAVVGGAMSAVRNGVAVFRGDKGVGEAVRDASVDAARSGVRGAAVGATGAVIRTAAVRGGLQSLAKANVATALAAAAVESGVIAWQLTRGEIDAAEAAERLGRTGVATGSGLFFGGAAALLIPGPGWAVAGSMAGYMLASSLYQGCLAILKGARLAEEEADQLVALADAAIAQLTSQRAEFEARLDEALEARDERWAHALTRVDLAMASATPEGAVDGLSDLAVLFDSQLAFRSRADFDRFMLEGDEPLVL